MKRESQEKEEDMIYPLLHLQTSAVSIVGHFQRSWQQSFFVEEKDLPKLTSIIRNTINM